jgi:hypothetical protein
MSQISLPRPWAAHAQIEWENRAADTNLPLWLRIVCVAYGRHEANGHANFQRGQLSWILGTPPTATRPFQPAHRATIYNAIQTAVRYAWLAEGSGSECLTVPAHAIEGPLGNPAKPCPVHTRKGARPKKGVPQLRSIQ